MTLPDRSLGDTPAFDELYDCARTLGTCEVVIVRVAGTAGPVLEVIVRRFDNGAVVHRAPVIASIEQAAARICSGLRRSLRD